jgi:hypothetical protein
MQSVAKIFDSPFDFFAFLFPKISSIPNPSVCPLVYIWVYRTNTYYDPNCVCPNKDMSMMEIEEGYKKITELSIREQNELLDFVGEVHIVLKLNGNVLGELRRISHK